MNYEADGGVVMVDVGGGYLLCRTRVNWHVEDGTGVCIDLSSA
jgi:hypothetical protein